MLLMAWLYRPYASKAAVFVMDRDALSLIGEIRATSRFVGWANGYFAHSLLVGAVSWLHDLTSMAYNDYTQAYQWLTRPRG